MANEKFKINGVVSEVVPTTGTTGDILKKTGSGVEWGSLTKATQTQDGLLSKEDFSKLAGIQAGAQVNAVTSVNGQTGAVTTPNTTYDAATTSANGLMSSADKVKLNGVETGAQKNTVTSVQGRTGAVTISKSDVGLSNVNNVAITAAQVTKINELNYTRAMTQAQYDALSPTEKNRTDVWYGVYKE